jgi:protein TonB
MKFLIAGTILIACFSQATPAAANYTNKTTLTDTLPKTSSDTALKFDDVEIEAEFPGGIGAWQQFLMENLNSNAPINKGAPAGTYNVVIQFIVDKDGKLIDMQPLTSFGFGMEAEVMRTLKRSPRWSPATQNGRYVKAYRKQPITFVVQEAKKKKKLL